MEPLSPAFPALDRIIGDVLAHWPEHRSFLEKSIAGRSEKELRLSDTVSAAILALHAGPLHAGQGLAAAIDGYRWMCGMVIEEELYFRRNKSYRHRTSEEVMPLVYGDAALMARYMDGLLLSQVLWRNHSQALAFYVARFLEGNSGSRRHLEIGPGHGLLLHLAARAMPEATLFGWDISHSSLRITETCLRTLGALPSVTLELRDVNQGAVDGGPGFDSIVISEVLEHVEEPVAVLSALRTMLAPNGRIFVNVPVNSPAIDHLYLLRSPEEAARLLDLAGFVVYDHLYAPATGYSEAAARRAGVSISCAFIAGTAP